MKNRLIFIVDDDEVLGKSLARFVSRLGYDARAISNGYDVLLNMEKLRPDLIISDIRMPKLDGISLLKGLKNCKETSNIPVIFMSGYSTDKILQDAVALGAKFFLFKPFPVEYLEDMIDLVLPEEYEVSDYPGNKPHEIEEYIIMCQKRPV